MNKRNKVKHLHRTADHRNAMLANMVTSLFHHEQIKSTVAKAKVASQVAEKLITRAKSNLKAEEGSKKLHNMRIVARVIRDKEVLNKLFTDIAPRVETRNGGYTRVIKVGRRPSDNSEMAVVELVDRKPLAQLKEERKNTRAQFKAVKTEKKPEKKSEKK